MNGLLVTLLASVGLGSIIGLITVFSGDFDPTAGKLSSSANIVAVFSLAALATAVWAERGRYVPLAVLGVAVSGLGALLSLIALWAGAEEDFGKLLGTVAIATVAIAWSSLLLLLQPRADWIGVIRGLTIVLIAALALIGIVLVWSAPSDPEVLAKALAILGIFTVLGTTAAPALNKLLDR